MWSARAIKVAGTSFLARESRHQRASRGRGEAREKDKKSKQIWRRATFFVLGYFCPVLNEIYVYPRLYLLVRPQLIPYIKKKLFPEFNAQVSKAKLRSIVHAVGGIGSARTRKMIIKMENQHTTTNYFSFQNLHKLYKTFGKRALVAILSNTPTTSSARTLRVTRAKRILAAIVEHFDRQKQPQRIRTNARGNLT